MSNHPKIIPVLDILRGQVVRGVAGNRETYAPIRSALVDSCEPGIVARALLRATGAEAIYIADLDMLRCGTSDFDVRILPDWNGTIYLDRGGLGKEPPDARFREIAAFEIGARPEFVRESFQHHRAAKPPVFSVDLRDGSLVGPWDKWGLRTPKDALGLVDRVWEIGFRTVIVLDVARVGVGGGTGTETLCTDIRERYPAMEIITGGGVRNWDDVDRLGDCGVDGVLVASALHDGTLSARDGFAQSGYNVGIHTFPRGLNMSATTEMATVGGGCYWCLEACFEQLVGVENVASGFTGGGDKKPTYESVCSGRTGHAEVVQVTFDPAKISYRELLEVFFAIHDPTTLNRQGADAGTQYRSAIFYHNAEQKAIAETAIAELTAEKAWADPIVTEIAPLTQFFVADDYHQGYFRSNPRQPYCMAVIAPKIVKTRKSFANRLKA